MRTERIRDATVVYRANKGGQVEKIVRRDMGFGRALWEAASTTRGIGKAGRSQEARWRRRMYSLSYLGCYMRSETRPHC